MKLLTLDTSQGSTSIAVSDKGQVCAAFQDDGQQQQAALLVTQLQQVLSEAGLDWRQLDGLACTTGPGGFTSVRIGIATLRGLAFAAGIPAYGAPLMEVMAWQACCHAGYDAVTCVLPAGRRDVCIQPYAMDGQRLRAVSERRLVSREAFVPEGTICSYGQTVDAPDVLFDVHEAAYLLAELLYYQPLAEYGPPVPLYAKPPDATIGTPLLKSEGAG